MTSALAKSSSGPALKATTTTHAQSNSDKEREDDNEEEENEEDGDEDGDEDEDEEEDDPVLVEAERQRRGREFKERADRIEAFNRKFEREHHVEHTASGAIIVHNTVNGLPVGGAGGFILSGDRSALANSAYLREHNPILYALARLDAATIPTVATENT